MSRPAKIALAAVVLLALAGGAAYWFVFKDDAAERFDAESAAEQVDDTETLDTVEGTWVTTDGSLAGYRIDEVFTGGANNTATARTSDVTGTIVIEATSVTAADVTVGMGGLASTDGNGVRDGRVRGVLETDAFPEATFRLTEPITLDAIPAPGEAISLTAVGELTLHGVTRPVEVSLEALIQGATLVVTGNAPVALADYGIQKPTAGRVVSIEDAGEFEFQLILTQG